MAPVRGAATYKKKDGEVTLSQDASSVIWTPAGPPETLPGLTIRVLWITSMCLE
jgi:hypothetical protein